VSAFRGRGHKSVAGEVAAAWMPPLEPPGQDFRRVVDVPKPGSLCGEPGGQECRGRTVLDEKCGDFRGRARYRGNSWPKNRVQLRRRRSLVPANLGERKLSE